jgi:hypothetical protein
MNKKKYLIEYLHLMAQWDIEKNTADPAQLKTGSGQKVWWVCGEGHSWEASVRNRVKGTCCPYCTGRKVLAGFNDLQSCNPALAAEWDPDKNELTPSQVTCC